MKSAVGTKEQYAQGPRVENLQPMAAIIMKTIADLGKPYGQNYITQLLTGSQYLEFRVSDHRELETVGKLRSKNQEDLICVIHHLVDLGFIEAREPDYITISLTETGKAWLAKPEELLVPRQNMRYSALEKYLRIALRDHRKQVATMQELKPWDIICDYTLDRIVLAKPLDLDALSHIPGFNTLKCEQFGAGFVKQVQHVFEHFEEYQRASLMVRVTRGSYPNVKKLFLENVTIPEIANVLTLQLSTVCTYLRELHEANHIDMIPWIERNLNAKNLYLGVEYYERVSRPNLYEAHSTLGLDYNILLFCRLYARDKRLRQQEAKQLAPKAVKLAS
jgi:ATP-dependent DNA helicase RecQ